MLVNGVFDQPVEACGYLRILGGLLLAPGFKASVRSMGGRSRRRGRRRVQRCTRCPRLTDGLTLITSRYPPGVEGDPMGGRLLEVDGEHAAAVRFDADDERTVEAW